MPFEKTKRKAKGKVDISVLAFPLLSSDLFHLIFHTFMKPSNLPSPFPLSASKDSPVTLCSGRVVGSNTFRLCSGTRCTGSSPFGRGQLWPLGSRAVSGWQQDLSASIHPLSTAFSRPKICKQPKEGTWSSSRTLRGGRVKSGGLSI